MIKHLLPRSLLGRSLLIIVVPLVLLQLVAALVFYQGHWDKVARRLALGLAGDIGAVSAMIRQDSSPENIAWIQSMASQRLAITVHYTPGEILPNSEPRVKGFLPERDSFVLALEERVKMPFLVDLSDDDNRVLVTVQLPDGVLQVISQRKRLFSSTTYIFVIWMVGTSLILFGVATIFMRNQVRPIRKLARAADAFGKRQPVAKFKAEGASEVRQAADAFLVMKERIERQIEQRTQMLAGVSHDLRTPLTRMKLELAMMSGEAETAGELKGDIEEMEHMLEAYLAFARGEGGEKPQDTNLTSLISDVVDRTRRHGKTIDYHSEGDQHLAVRPNAFARCVGNLVENAARYGEHVSVRVGQRGETIDITVDDDGPGVPEDKREDVFKPFFRLDSSRNIHTGGVGLGLAIVRDVVRGHGGDIMLSDSPMGGLRARLRFPI